MTIVQHISMRVPWRDRPWDDKVCDSPLDNSSCLLLTNIGGRRRDDWETGVAGRSFTDLHQYDRLPCLSERGTFMSSHGYVLKKEHPYRFNRALSGHLEPTKVSVPPYSFEAVPFRWLSRETVDTELWQDADEYRPEREDSVRKLLGFTPGWVMDGRNQRALMDRFFENVVAGESLVLIYLKHSPLQEESARRLLVGAATVTAVTAPPMWNQSGRQPFDSAMWETLVSHSLRADQKNGILLPYQALIPLLEAGKDVSGALAWAPDDATAEFSYVTEHVSDDTAIAALNSLRAAADGMTALGIAVSPAAVVWADRQIERLWQLRGPAPGLAAVLGYLGVESAHRVVRRLIDEPDWNQDPWGLVERALDRRDPLGAELRLPASIGLTWRGLSADEQTALMIVSAMDVDREQVADLMDGRSTWQISAADLVENPYCAATCTYRSRHPIALVTVDQACFPAEHVPWVELVDTLIGLDDPGDPRRLEALIVEVLERLAEEGDTLVSEPQVLTAAAAIPLTRPCPISRSLLVAHKLDPAQLADYQRWTPLVAAELEGRLPAYKLLHLHEVGLDISDAMQARRKARRFDVPFDPRASIDAAFGAADPSDAEEELARVEKATGLGELFAARLSVLVGPAGTGKTSLLKTLVARPEIAQDGILLLAPTGKARVQLQTKVDHEAQTLASFLVKKSGYDPGTGRYLTVGKSKRSRFGLVVIDEASMLTEEMLAATLSALQGVKRLILVGDHRQLPPIGAGRPFVDIVEWLKPDGFTDPVKVAPGYVELTVFRRQKSEDGERHDLALARWFGGEDLPGAADEIWHQIRLGTPSDTLAYRQWGDTGIAATLLAAIEDELGLIDATAPENDFKLTYGGRVSSDGKWIDWPRGPHGAGDRCEEWQILSPTRSRVFGTTELNRLLKQKYRVGDLEWAQKRYGYRPPKPLGPEQIVLGDKVMQTRNNSRAKAWPDGAGLDYIANGEIGVVVGRASTSPKYANVEFSSQIGATYGYLQSSSEDPWLELAWAVTVHKSQGSEFGVTFLVLPARVAVSRELLYTALTRHTKKLVILHEGTADDLFALASPALSETARRMTDLFRRPAPRELTVGDGMRRFDGNLIHVAPGGVLVRSKNEVIIASILDEIVPDRWSYEQPLTIDGVTKYPDFTIETASGDELIWEHLGMMNNPRYAADWAAKKAWYVANGLRPYDEPDADGSRGVLVWTDDRGGVDQPAWAEMARQVIGVATPRRVIRRAAGRQP
ncbi:ATP-dependent RecD-like DNA helicase [Frankia sp. R82]|uniref:ATP-dependent DNA helicase n=1 Tax=Frankia sp. R82 TaxID=2950553 RepID=UPI002042C8DC|nr:ATP-dependent RecD-like DNA helicase [Frankia sp. R82]MCM3885060.1 ATP-dependent RecD-like DNA helicase [Frankia sp. R82]